jgi:hypothetical protein
MFEIKVVEKMKVHILCLIHFSENRDIYENVENYGGVRDATDGNKAARCMLDK